MTQTRGFYRIVGVGRFHCENCRDETYYTVRRRLVFRLPFATLKKVSLHVKCDRCAAESGLDVLGEAEVRQYLNLEPLPVEPWVPAQPERSPLADTYEELGGEDVALARAIAVEVLRRADDVTVSGLAAGVRLVMRDGAGDYRVDNLRHDIGNLEVAFLRALIGERVAGSRLQGEQARSLVSSATRIAHANGHITAQQWDWIVLFGLDAGIGPTASRAVRAAVVDPTVGGTALTRGRQG